MEESIEIAYTVNGHCRFTHTVKKSDVFKYTSPKEWQWYKTLDIQHEGSYKFWREAHIQFAEVIWTDYPWETAIRIERESMHKLLAFIDAALAEHEANKE